MTMNLNVSETKAYFKGYSVMCDGVRMQITYNLFGLSFSSSDTLMSMSVSPETSNSTTSWAAANAKALRFALDKVK